MCNFPYKFTQQLRGNQDFSLLKQYLLHPWYFEGLSNTVGVQGLTLTDGYFVKPQNSKMHLHSLLETQGRILKSLSHRFDIQNG